MKRAKLSFKKRVQYFHNERGAGVKVDGSTNYDTWIVKTADDIEFNFVAKGEFENKFKTAVKKALYYEDDYFAISDDGRVYFNSIEDIEGNALTIEEQRKLHAKGEQLYLCDYDIIVEIQEVYEPDVDELKNLLPTFEIY